MKQWQKVIFDNMLHAPFFPHIQWCVCVCVCVLVGVGLGLIYKLWLFVFQLFERV